MDIFSTLATTAFYTIVIFSFTMLTAMLAIYGERRGSALIQDRHGPNRVGWFGSLQLIADLIKLLTKEDRVIDGADRPISFIAPLLAFIPGFIVAGFIPFGTLDGRESLVFIDIPLGALMVLAVSTIAAYGISYGGWASNSKYALLGGLRSSAQIISFEIAMGMAILSVILFVGTGSLSEIIAHQGFSGHWFSWVHPVAFIIFFIAAFAETNRTPFDFPEAEQELVGGFHTEYSSMKFASFMIGEYLAITAMSALLVVLFLGGWDLGIDRFFLGPDHNIYTWILQSLPENLTLAYVFNGVLSFSVFYFKVLVILWIFIWVRWTIPRLQWTQLMKMGWSVLIPLAFANLIISAIIIYLTS